MMPQHGLNAKRFALLGALASGATCGANSRADPQTADAYASASDHDQTRALLEQEYVDQFSQRNGLYQSAPITHVVPSFKTVTIAMAGAKYDTTIKDSEFPRTSYLNGGYSQSLALTGYQAASYVAVSLQRIGLGFSAETGEKHAAYSLYRKNGGTDDGTRTQASDMDYKAVGVYAYLLPYASAESRTVIASVVIGAKNYNVNHRVSATLGPSDHDPGTEKYRYNLNEYEFGTLVEFKLLKFFSLVPWFDWTFLDTHDPTAQADDRIAAFDGKDQQQTEIARTLKGDVAVFWQARPRLDLGLDLVAKTHGVAVHLGQLLGFLVNSRGTDTIVDRSYAVNISVNLKGE